MSHIQITHPAVYLLYGLVAWSQADKIHIEIDFYFLKKCILRLVLW